MPVTLDDMRRFAVARSLFPPTTLKRVFDKLGFVQADPIRSPARAQDLILRHRVKGYRAGDLDRQYDKLGVEEDFFINYGFVTRSLQALMHPRVRRVPAEVLLPMPPGRKKRADLLLAFVHEKGTVHPREVDTHFSHGRVKNYWGGSSNATTHMLDVMHYQGLLRVVRREAGIRLYGPRQHENGPGDAAARRARLDALADVAIRIYAPMPARSLALLLRRLRYAVPQWQKDVAGALKRARERLSHAHIDGIEWYWPAGERFEAGDAQEQQDQDKVRLLAPFDPVVWDRARFELLWGWAYRFEAYTPVAKRLRGYYAMPLLWRDQVVGWGNLSAMNGQLKTEFGYVKGRTPSERVFARELEAEIERMQSFLKVEA